MSAFGRKQTVGCSNFQVIECPLWVKADIQISPARNLGCERPVYTRKLPLARLYTQRLVLTRSGRFFQ